MILSSICHINVDHCHNAAICNLLCKAENTSQILNSSYGYATWILLSITANLNSNFIK